MLEPLQVLCEAKLLERFVQQRGNYFILGKQLRQTGTLQGYPAYQDPIENAELRRLMYLTHKKDSRDYR